MKRKRARHLYLEIARRIYLNKNGNLRGFGKIARFYNHDWRPDIRAEGGYKAVWESALLHDLRNSVGM